MKGFIVNGVKNLNYLKILKITIGCVLAMYFAYLLELEFYTACGIITILTILDTKKETLSSALKRVISFALSLLIAFIVFNLFAFDIFTFGLFILIFAGISYLLKINDHIVVNSVLITHFLSFKVMGYYEVRNEVLLMFIGGGIGVLLNLYMPSMIKIIKNDQLIIEAKMKEILIQFGDRIIGVGKRASLIDELGRFVGEAVQRAEENADNRLFDDVKYYLNYMKMRYEQIIILESISNDIDNLNYVYSQSHIMSDFMKEISESFHEHNNAASLLERLDKLKEQFKLDNLPQDRNEFENRAILYQILLSLERFLLIKRYFVFSLSEKELKRFWQ